MMLSSRVARYGLRATAGFTAVTGVALGQAVLHERSYRPLPSLEAPEKGLELPERLQRLAREKREALVRRLEEKTEEMKSRTRALAEPWRALMATLRRPTTTLRRTTTSEHGGSVGEEGKRPYRVLFIGDSLVTGIGGESDAAKGGPPLPRRVSRALAESLGVLVEWRALGITGGDLKAMRESLVPEITRHDVVVVMCGLNDLKYLARGELRTPWGFKDELTALLDDIRAAAGDDCRIILPALPVALAHFREPLKSYLVFLANQWDRQKARLASRLLHHKKNNSGIVEYVDALVVSNGSGARLVADDGVHPNESGYALWANHIATHIVAKEPPALRARREVDSRLV